MEFGGKTGPTAAAGGFEELFMLVRGGLMIERKSTSLKKSRSLCARSGVLDMPHKGRFADWINHQIFDGAVPRMLSGTSS